MLPAALRFALAMIAVTGLVIGVERLIDWLRREK
jgi:hypothetical protein